MKKVLINNEIKNLRVLTLSGMDALSLAMIQCAIELLEADKATLRRQGCPHT
ncbi:MULTISPECIES: hypothetical protein [unclassified Bradyrhizobium]|uniref:hypothetical protein n=1 Tax=unclassified Bradyrhizobium TaxID=2631580 RepID=UPI0020B43E12|nr:MULTISPECIES: hypothetical protein [unclassified Bradyrhizobium]MCP3397783.1 hypothetical protein [Bradyrhizobium sp. CCGB20]MCP3406372.1 hypothetical protein [Bradyrhizobium sp. CCGB01]